MGSLDIMQLLENGADDYDAVWPASSIWVSMGDTNAPKYTLADLEGVPTPQPATSEIVSQTVAEPAVQLSAADQKKAEELAATIDFRKDGIEGSFGRDSQLSMTDFADSVLTKTRSKDTGEAGNLLRELLGTVDDSELSGVKQVPIIGQVVVSTDKLRRRYQKVAPQIDEIVEKLQRAQAQMVKDVALYDVMYDRNVEQYRQLKIYVTAGKKALDLQHEVDETTTDCSRPTRRRRTRGGGGGRARQPARRGGHRDAADREPAAHPDAARRRCERLLAVRARDDLGSLNEGAGQTVIIRARNYRKARALRLRVTERPASCISHYRKARALRSCAAPAAPSGKRPREGSARLGPAGSRGAWRARRPCRACGGRAGCQGRSRRWHPG